MHARAQGFHDIYSDGFDVHSHSRTATMQSATSTAKKQNQSPDSVGNHATGNTPSWAS
jgi:hypothetical protein